jgi:hypothetical protein
MPPVFIDPKLFLEGEYTIILCNDSQGSLDWFIKWFDKGNYCHAMETRTPMLVCTQNDMYKEIPLNTYLINSEELKFWRINNLTPDEFTLINNKIDSDLSAPWYKRMYNYLGLIGQGLHLPWVSMPGQDICSQRVAGHLRLLPRLAAVIPEHPSPADLDALFIANPTLFTNIGYYWQD